MDESTLNDLLECSVCLDRLDTSSKVLPCQHIFHRKCLEVIFASRQELRCPECRILVEIRISELPTNVLLMRILGGLKSENSTENPPNEETDKDKEKDKSVHQPPLKAIQENSQRRCLLPHAYALYDFESSESTDLNFKKGNLILLKHKIDSNWYVGQLNGKEGTFPSNYVQVIVPLPTPQAVALYDFKMGPNEEEGCLNFKKGAFINVLRRVDHNWAEGRIGNTIGIFPIAFVELNALAKKLLERIEPKMQIQQNEQLQPSSSLARNLPPIPLLDPTSNNSDTTTTTSPSSSSHSNTTSPSASDIASNNHLRNTGAVTTSSSSSNLSTNSNSLPTTPQHYAHGSGSVRYRNGREKRHSLNALLISSGSGGNTGLSILQTNRHSAEILSIPSEELIVSENNETADKQTENLGAGAMPQSNSGREQRQVPSNSMQSATSTRANVLKTACGRSNVPPSLPWGYLALYPYKPRKSDELELKKGCVYIVMERCLDGWFKGKNWQDICGVFPGNYVTPLRARDQQQLMHQWKFVPQPTQSQQHLQTSTRPLSSINSNLNLPKNNVNIQQQQPQQQNATKSLPIPPELPPRHSATITCASVWTKPLSHTVEAFFNRNSSTSNSEKSKEKEIKTKEKEFSTSGAVSLMKRFTNIKSRPKSPGAVARNNAPSTSTSSSLTSCSNTKTATVENSTHAINKPLENPLQIPNSIPIQAVHTRSGSCPSQLLQNTANVKTQQQPQHSSISNHGCEINPNERQRIQVASRQSMDSNLRSGIYSATPSLPNSNLSNNFQLNPKCAQQFQMHQTQFGPSSMPHFTNHRKSNSLDANNLLSSTATNTMPIPSQPLPLPQLSMQNPNITAAAVTQSATTKSTHCGRESRFRCIVPYPPNSEVELELHVGDIIYVQRKQKNGWYKGTHARTQKTGLFPASFVEPDL